MQRRSSIDCRHSPRAKPGDELRAAGDLLTEFLHSPRRHAIDCGRHASGYNGRQRDERAERIAESQLLGDAEDDADSPPRAERIGRCQLRGKQRGEKRLRYSSQEVAGCSEGRL